jgi:hypothetical protein
MKNIWRFFVVGLLLVPATGCSDSPEMLYHDLVIFWNEIADTMLTVNDEATAKEVMKTRGKQYKARADVLKDRIMKVTDPPNGKLNKTEKEDYNAATLDYIEELIATSKRLSHALQRLDSIISAIKAKDSSAPTTELQTLRDLPCAFDFRGSSGGGMGNIGKQLDPGRFIISSEKNAPKGTGGGVGSPCGAGGGFGRGR